MKLIVNVNDVIVFIGEKADIVENGIDVGGMIFGEQLLEVKTVDIIPTEVRVQKHCYNDDRGFYPNPNYQERPEDRIEQLEQQVNDLTQAMAAILGGGM